MTLSAFLEAYTAALVVCDARPFQHQRGIWPHGDLLRVHVVPPAGVLLPPALDPIGLVWYAQTGEFRPVRESRYLAEVRLDLPAALVVVLLAASDGPSDHAHVAAVRAALLAPLRPHMGLPGSTHA